VQEEVHWFLPSKVKREAGLNQLKYFIVITARRRGFARKAE